jgi:ribonuclease/clavin/mitogillin
MIEFGDYNKDISYIKTASEFNNDALMWVYSYRIDNVMFDAGCPNAKHEFKEYLKHVDIDKLVISHFHEDHSGGASLFVDKAIIYARPETREIIRDPPQLSEFFQWAWGQPEPVENVEVVPEVIEIGDMTFETIELFGHSPEMIGLYEKERGWLFSADAVPSQTRKNAAMPEENVPRIIETMEKILRLKPKVLFDGHRGPIENPSEHISKRVGFLKELQKKIQDMHGNGLSISEIKDQLDLEPPWYMDLTEGRFSFDHLIKSLLTD